MRLTTPAKAFSYACCGAETFVERCQFAQGNCHRFLLCGNVQPVLNGIAGGKAFCVVIDQPRGIDAMFNFAVEILLRFIKLALDRFAQDQRIAVTKNVVRQLVKLLVSKGRRCD